MAELARLGHYRILGSLGRGGMGEVFRARDTKLEREVALKLLPAAFTADSDRHARFHREARSMAAFSHPHVAAVHAIEEDGDHHFIAMELVDGPELTALIAEGPLPVARALELARQMAAGIEAAHHHGIVHRDLKPANVKINGAGLVKILDFGLAKVLADSDGDPGLDDPTVATDRTNAGVVLGTAAYMSPEQARGQEVDKRADVWAFGVILFEMVSGRRPFAGQSVSDTLAAVLRNEPPWSALPAELPAPVARLLRRCLQKDPHHRLHDIADARIVLEDLEDGDGPYAAGSPLAAVPAFAPEAGLVGAPARSRRRRTLLAWLGWGLALAAACLAAFFALLPGQEPPRPPRLATLTYSGRDWAPSASPDGTVIAFVSDRDGVSRIWLKQIAGGGEAPLTEGHDDLPRFSPDGSQILFVRDTMGRRDLYRVSVLGGAPRKVVADVAEGDWSPDGASVGFLRLSREEANNMALVGVASLQSGQERILHRITNRLCYGLRWSPDGDLIYAETSLTGNISVSAALNLVDGTTGAVTDMRVTEIQTPYTAPVWSPDGRSMVIGQSTDLISHVSGLPAKIMQAGRDGRVRPLFWAPVRLPRGGWGYSTMAVLNDTSMVFDRSTTRAELWTVPLGGAAEATTALTTSLGRDRQPAFSPDGERVIFSSNRSGNVDLWVVGRDGSGLRQLTDDAANDWDPAFTPDGRGVLWSSDRSGTMEIWLASADGSGARQVSNDGQDAENPTMTPDGQWIVYASSNDEKLGIWKVRPDGSDAVLLAAGAYLLPEVSPDGRHAMFSSVRNLNYVLSVIEVEAGAAVPFEIEMDIAKRHEDLVYGRARWAPDGRSIYYIGQDGSGRSGVFARDFRPDAAARGEPRPVAGFSPHFTTESLGVSPDGGSLVISVVHDQRTLVQVTGLSLRDWSRAP